jgi:hypothetical protein
MAAVNTATRMRALVSTHINSIADAFFSLGGERTPDFVLGLTTLDEAFAFSSRSSISQWIAYLRLHKLVIPESAPSLKIFERNLAKPSDVYQLKSISPAAAVDILLRACRGDGAASTDFDTAFAMALSQSGPHPEIANQISYISLAQVSSLMIMLCRLLFLSYSLVQFSAALCALASRCIRSVTEFGIANRCSNEASFLALLQHLQIVDNM